MVHQPWSEIPDYLARYFDKVDVSRDEAISECDTIMRVNYRAALDAIIETESVGDLEWFYYNWTIPESAWEYFPKAVIAILHDIGEECSHELYEFIESFIAIFITNPTIKERLYTRLEKYE